MRKLVFILWMMVCLFLPLAQDVRGDEFGRNGHLIMLIKSSKPKYEIGEPISIIAALKNHTDVPLIVNNRFHPGRDLEWDLFHDGFGYVQLKTLPADPLKAEDFVRMEPSEEIVQVLPNLNEIFSAPLKAGRYALRVRYMNKETPKGKETWTGLIVTNLLWFEVKASEKI